MFHLLLDFLGCDVELSCKGHNPISFMRESHYSIKRKPIIYQYFHLFIPCWQLTPISFVFLYLCMCKRTAVKLWRRSKTGCGLCRCDTTFKTSVVLFNNQTIKIKEKDGKEERLEAPESQIKQEVWILSCAWRKDPTILLWVMSNKLTWDHWGACKHVYVILAVIRLFPVVGFFFMRVNTLTVKQIPSLVLLELK